MTMNKDSTVSVRLQTNIKIEAEDILKQLGIPVSVLIDSLYRQIILQRGVPFSLTLPSEPKTVDSMSQEELNTILEHSYQQAMAGKGKPVQEVFDHLKRGGHGKSV
ncbi:MAG: type II toxin-antitoxin system RelB/DinJ family antitoxin [Lactimicrobium sp.]|jgi:DNA-damage-inducible protein J|uniref:type II toxin-antitoxin system RelB/DinJ family antitoxin n=1 Tax=Lactimicrobium sp. TaxID=2563780 RepID=UPI002F353836